MFCIQPIALCRFIPSETLGELLSGAWACALSRRQKKTTGNAGGSFDSIRRLLLLVSIHSESLLSLMSRYLMLLSLSSARHLLHLTIWNL